MRTALHSGKKKEFQAYPFNYGSPCQIFSLNGRKLTYMPIRIDASSFTDERAQPGNTSYTCWVSLNGFVSGFKANWRITGGEENKCSQKKKKKEKTCWRCILSLASFHQWIWILNKTVSLKRIWIRSGAGAASIKGSAGPHKHSFVAAVERATAIVRAKQGQILEVTIKCYQRPVIMVRGNS